MIDQIIFDTTDADTRADTHTIGAVLYDKVNDRLGIINADGEVLVRDEDVLNAVNSVNSTLSGTLSVSFAPGSTVQITDGTDTLGVNADGSINVAATDLDIRSLDHTSAGNNDSVRLGDGTNFITSTLFSSKRGLDVNIIDASNIDINDDLATTTIKQVPETVTAAAAQVVDGSDEVSGRKHLWIYNNGNRRVFLGDATVSAANGFPISPRGHVETRIGDAVDVYMVAAGGSQNVRTLQLA